jgi:hypothetical protein
MHVNATIHGVRFVQRHPRWAVRIGLLATALNPPRRRRADNATILMFGTGVLAGAAVGGWTRRRAT